MKSKWSEKASDLPQLLQISREFGVFRQTAAQASEHDEQLDDQSPKRKVKVVREQGE